MLTVYFEGIKSRTGWRFGWNMSDFELKVACMLAVCGTGMDIFWNTTLRVAAFQIFYQTYIEFDCEVFWNFCILADICLTNVYNK